MVSEAKRSFGMTRRELSSVRTKVYVSPISSTVPTSSPITTSSPRRTGCVKAIRIPAMKLPSVVRAANPMMSPMMAEEASRPPAIARTCGITSRAERTPTTTIAVMTVRRSTR